MSLEPHIPSSHPIAPVVHERHRNNSASRIPRLAGLAALLLAVACGSSPPRPPSVVPPLKPPAEAPRAPKDPAAWRLTPPAAGKSAAVSIPAPEVSVLANGMTLYTLERPTGLESLSVVVRHGASDVPRGKTGLAALIAQMAAEGTTRRTSEELAEAVENLGTTLGTDAGRDYVRVTLDALRGDVETALGLLAEVIGKPGFREADFARVKKTWLDGLIAERQNPARLASLAGLSALLGPELGAPVGGRIPDVGALTVNDLRTWHDTWIVPSSTAVVAVGPLAHDALKKLVVHHFADFRRKPAPTSLPPAAAPSSSPRTVWVVDRPGSVQSALFVAQTFPRRNEPGHEAREVLVDVLGGLFTSRINQNLREKNAFTYGAHAVPVATRHMGALVISTNVETAVTAKALTELERELSAIRGSTRPEDGKVALRPVSADELQAAKADLINELGAHQEHTRRLAQDLETIFVQGLNPSYYATYPTVVGALAATDVARASELLVIPPSEPGAPATTPDPQARPSLVAVVVGDRQVVEPLLKNDQRRVLVAPEDWSN